VGTWNIKTQSYEGNPFRACIWSRSSAAHGDGLAKFGVTRQSSLLAKVYHEVMMDKIDDILESQFNALEEI
jgi:hypothetical protein